MSGYMLAFGLPKPLLAWYLTKGRIEELLGLSEAASLLLSWMDTQQYQFDWVKKQNNLSNITSHTRRQQVVFLPFCLFISRHQSLLTGKLLSGTVLPTRPLLCWAFRS